MTARWLFVAALAAPSTLHAQTPPPERFAPRQVFIAPSGEPFRALSGEPYPVALWFAAADRNHDGRIDRVEFVADLERFFATLDTDHDGRLSSDEVTRYERVVAPEVQAWQAGGFGGRPGGFGGGRDGGHRHGRGGGGRGRGGGESGGGGEPSEHADEDGPKADQAAVLGAGRFGMLNIPEPVVGMDTDLDGTITRDEVRAAAGRRFDLLDPAHGGSLTLAGLPHTMAQRAAEH
nr:EF-hand domain-containing protein [Sphingomonadaceae bacterium]